MRLLFLPTQPPAKPVVQSPAQPVSNPLAKPSSKLSPKSSPHPLPKPASMSSSLRPVLPVLLAAALFLAWPPSVRAAEAEPLPTEPEVDAVAPGYPLYGDDTVYRGHGTRPDAPAVPLELFGDAAEKDGRAKKEAAEDEEAMKALMEAGAKEGKKPKKAKEGLLRERMLREAAGTVAFQKSLAATYAALLDHVREKAAVLDRLFNFQALLVRGRALPPVVRWMGPSATFHDDQSATFVEASYRIEAPARIVSVAPTWRDYLETDFEAFEPRPDTLPENDAEREVWREGVRIGWEEGRRQAREIFDLNLSRLVADFRGMLRFRMLAKDGMVGMPRLAEGDLGVRVGDRTLNVNETVFRITVPASFLPPDEWAKDGQTTAE